MQRRIFIAINLPENIKSKLACHQDEIDQLFASHQNEGSNTGLIKWTKKRNLHITLEFLGYLTDEELIELCEKTKKIASEKKSFDINLSKICYGPLWRGGGQPDKKPPRMIWATGEKIKEFNLVPHITLGRIRAWEFRRLEPEERPEINQDIDLNFEVKSIEIMESQLKKGGVEYTILESCLLTPLEI